MPLWKQRGADMRSIERRVVSLEGRGHLRDGLLLHLSDAELAARAVNLIERFGEAGVALPEDWRDLCARDVAGFLNWVGKEAEGLLA